VREPTDPVGEGAERAPEWAFSVNETARHDGLAITLLTCTIVDHLVRITGLFRLDGLFDARLAFVPQLAVSSRDGVPLTSVSAHVLPHGRIAWVSWLFERPATVLSEYEARIDTVSVDYPLHRGPIDEHAGPWAFRFELPPRPAAARMLAALGE
jgi:hypothetical protein